MRSVEMSGLTIRSKRGSRGSATLLEAANRILKLLGVSSTKRGKQPSTKAKVTSRQNCLRTVTFVKHYSFKYNYTIKIT